MSLRRSALASGALALSLSIPASVEAQSSFEDAITPFNARDVRGYVQPLADVLVANLSNGYFYTSGPRSSLGFSIELAAMGTTISDKLRTYTANTPEGFNPTTFQAPTIFGGKATTVQHTSIPSLSYRTSDGVLDADMFPTAVPQVRVSGLFNTEVVVRYFDSDLLGSSYPKEDLPNLNMYGVGVRHGISQYLPGMPFDLSISASYNSMKFGEYVELTGTTFGANIGKGFGLLSVMGGIESAGGKMNLAYTSTNDEAPGSVDIDLEAARGMRVNAGAMLDLKLIKLFGTAGFGNVTTFSAGLRVGF